MRLPLAAGILLLLAPAPEALAWGDTGHEIICEITFREVAPATRERIKVLIGTDQDFTRFSEACTWPDHPRKRGPAHFLNLPRDAAGLAPTDTCAGAGACVVSAIEHDLGVLSSPTAGEADKLKALKFLGHWVGDVHQPLHVSFADDRGGNLVDTEGSCGSGERANLHAAWDTCLLERTLGRDVRSIATKLLAEITEEQKEQWNASGPAEWANESFRITTDPASSYCFKEDGHCAYEEGNEVLDQDEEHKVVSIDAAYVEANGPVIRDRLKRAGTRLAHLLDRSLGQ
jgi:hypothetical protein